MSKLSLSQAWEESRAVLGRDGRLFLAVALALFVLPGLILNASMPEAPLGEFPPPGPWMIVGLAALLVWIVGQLAVIRLAIPPHVSVGESIVHAVKRLLPYILAGILWFVPILIVGSVLSAILETHWANPPVIVSLALILLVAIGFFLFVRLILSSAVASAESIGPVPILRRSWELSKGNWWRLFLFLLLFWVGALCLLWAVDIMVGLLVRTIFSDIGPLTIGGLIIGLVSQLVSALISVIFFVFLARLYEQRSASFEVQPGVPRSGT